MPLLFFILFAILGSTPYFQKSMQITEPSVRTPESLKPTETRAVPAGTWRALMTAHPVMFEVGAVGLGLAVVVGVIFTGFVRPRQHVEQVRAQNDSNVVALRRAIDQLARDSGGSLDDVIAIPTVATLIGSGAGEVNLCDLLVPSYLAVMPRAGDDSNDASGVGATSMGNFSPKCTHYETGYTIKKSKLGEITVEAAK